MKKALLGHLFGLLGLSMLLTGCYREEIAQLHNQVDAIEFREIVYQVEEMKSTVSEIRELSSQLNALITPLLTIKGELEEQISANKGDINGLKDQLKTVNSTLNDLLGVAANISSLETRIVDLEKADYGAKIEETKKNLDEALKQLEGLAKIKSDIEKLKGETSEIPEIKKSIEDLKGSISDGIIKAIEQSKDEIFKWISENPDIQGALSNYYTKSQIDAMVGDIPSIKARLDGLGDEIRNAVNEAIEGAFGNVEEFKKKVEGFGTEINKLRTAIGDLSKLSTEAKDNLVNAINELAAKVKASAGELDAYFDSTKVNNLLSGLESLLTIAIMDGDNYANLRIDTLCNKILDITTAETRLIDSRIEAAIDALGDIFITRDSLKNLIGDENTKGSIIARIAALEAINVTIESKNYTSWADAVKAVYDSLNSRIGSISAIQRNISDLTTSIQNIEGIIGNGDNYFTTTNTIAAAIKNLNSLVSSLSTETSLRAAIDSLVGIHDALINALLGVTSGGKVADITAENNLNALKAKIDNFFSGTGVTSIKAAMDSLNKNIDAVKAIIGGDYSSSNTVSAAIEDLETRLSTLEGLGYDDELNSINTVIDSVRTVLANKVDADTFNAAKSRIDSIANVLNSLSVNSKTGLQNILDDLSNRISEVKDTNNVQRTDIEALKKQISDINGKLDSNFLWNLLSGNLSSKLTELIENITKFKEILERLNKIDVQFVYIPDYLYGDQVTVNYHNGAVVGGTSLIFNVYSTQEIKSSTFTTNSIRGIFVQTQKIGGTKAAPSNAVKPSDVSYNNGILTVTFSQSDVDKYFTGGSIAIVYGEFNDGDTTYNPWYSTSYIPMHFVDTGDISLSVISGGGVEYDSGKSFLNIPAPTEETTIKVVLAGCNKSSIEGINYQSLGGGIGLNKNSFFLEDNGSNCILSITLPAGAKGSSGRIVIDLGEGNAFTFIIKLK